MAVTLSDLKTRSLLRADMPTNSARYASGQVENYINQALGELYDILISVEGHDRFITSYDFVTVAAQTEYTLPTNFYKSAGIDLNIDSSDPANEFYTLLQFSHSDRMLYKNASDHFVNSVPRYRYRIAQSNITIYPAPSAVYNVTLYYIPQLTKLTATTDEVQVEIVESWLEYVEVSVAAKLLDIDEELEKAGLLNQLKGQLVQRIQASGGRDLERPDVELDGDNSLFNLRLQARYKANMVDQGSKNNSLISDRELTHYINRSLEELYDLIIQAYDANYFLDGYEFTTVSGQRNYNLPTDFYKLAGVDIVVSGETYSLSNYNFAERNYYETSSSIGRWDSPLMHYQLTGSELRILPAPEQTYTCKIWYTKVPAYLTADSDAVESVVIRGWLEYVTIDAAIKMLNKFLIGGGDINKVQTAIKNLHTQKSAIKQRLIEMIDNRNWGQPEKMVDIDRTTWLIN